MPLITKWGGMWDSLPFNSGRKFFVSPGATYTIEGETYSASNNNDGLSPERALRTIAGAQTKVTASADDMVILLPGAHTVSTASIAASKARVTYWGMPGGSNNWVRPRTSVTTDITADQIFNVTAADIEFANIRFIPITASSAIDFTLAAARLYVHDCSIDMATPAADTATQGIAATASTIAPANVLIEHNYFEITGAQGAALVMGDCQDFVVSRNLFATKGGTLAVLTSQFGVLGWGVYVDNTSVCLKNATITKGITGTDLTSTLSVGILRNFFGGTHTTPIDDWGTTDAFIAENYLASTGAAGGGVLWSSIT